MLLLPITTAPDPSLVVISSPLGMLPSTSTPQAASWPSYLCFPDSELWHLLTQSSPCPEGQQGLPAQHSTLQMPQWRRSHITTGRGAAVSVKALTSVLGLQQHVLQSLQCTESHSWVLILASGTISDFLH